MMIQTANSVVVTITVRVPNPESTVRTGTRAVSGAACMTIEIGESSRTNRALSPMPTAELALPATSGFSEQPPRYRCPMPAHGLAGCAGTAAAIASCSAKLAWSAGGRAVSRVTLPQATARRTSFSWSNSVRRSRLSLPSAITRWKRSSCASYSFNVLAAFARLDRAARSLERLARGVDRRLARDARLDDHARPHHAEGAQLTAELDGRAGGRAGRRAVGDEGALADMAPDHALALERTERLAQRGARHPELVRQVALGQQPATPLEPALTDEASQTRGRIGRTSGLIAD